MIRDFIESESISQKLKEITVNTLLLVLLLSVLIYSYFPMFACAQNLFKYFMLRIKKFLSAFISNVTFP